MGIEPGPPGEVGEGKPSLKFNFGGVWEGGLVQKIITASTCFEAKASADLGANVEDTA